MPPLGHLERVLSTKVVSQLCEDNSVVVTIWKSGFCAKLRHMNRTHRISVAGLAELIEPREIELKPTETESQLADIATMPLVKAKFVSAREQLCVISSDQIHAIRGKNGHTHTHSVVSALDPKHRLSASPCIRAGCSSGFGYFERNLDLEHGSL